MTNIDEVIKEYECTGRHCNHETSEFHLVINKSELLDLFTQQEELHRKELESILEELKTIGVEDELTFRKLEKIEMIINNKLK